jgi:hypothetical protein
MEHDLPPQLAAQDYAVLRQSGTQAARARVQLRLSAPDAHRLEQVFQARTARGAGDRQLPRFARHDRHVAAVLAQGGFWAFSERRLGKDVVVVCLPLIPPAP